MFLYQEIRQQTHQNYMLVYLAYDHDHYPTLTHTQCQDVRLGKANDFLFFFSFSGQ